MIENPAGLDYNFWKVLITPASSGSPLRHRGFFVSHRFAPWGMPLSVRLGGRLLAVYQHPPARAVISAAEVSSRSIPA